MSRVTMHLGKIPTFLMLISVLVAIFAVRSELDLLFKIGVVGVCFALFLCIGVLVSWLQHVTEKEKIEEIFQQ